MLVDNWGILQFSRFHLVRRALREKDENDVSDTAAV